MFTIIQGLCVFVCGEFVKKLPDGRVVVSLGEVVYVGWPTENHPF